MAVYWTNDIIDPDELVGFAVLPESADAFHTGWDNAEAQDLARQGAAEADPAKRKEIYFRIQELYSEESPMIPLYYKHPPTGQYNWRTTWVEGS
jgi:peptide/nickel transport system substrate-binding protein